MPHARCFLPLLGADEDARAPGFYPPLYIQSQPPARPPPAAFTKHNPPFCSSSAVCLGVGLLVGAGDGLSCGAGMRGGAWVGGVAKVAWAVAGGVGREVGA